MIFIQLSSFERSAKGLFSEEDILELEITLIENPQAGDVIPGGFGLRKLRRPLQGRGKRGGARVIYYHISAAGKIILISAYAKNEKSDLTKEQLKQLTKLCHE